MAIQEESNFELPPVGNHLARCYALIDLGYQKNLSFGNVKKKVLFLWELVDKRLKDGSPFQVRSKHITVSRHENSDYYTLYKTWKGKDIKEYKGTIAESMKNLVGEYCLVNIIHNGKYANVAGVTPLPDSMIPNPNIEKTLNDLIIFELDDDENIVDEEMWNKLSPSIQEKISKRVMPDELEEIRKELEEQQEQEAETESESTDEDVDDSDFDMPEGMDENEYLE